MPNNSDLDLLSLNRGLVIAPAGCGKTQLIVDALKRHKGSKPILVLTHTNAGVAALRNRLASARVSSTVYKLATIDGWAIRLISNFPERSGHDPLVIKGHRPNYVAIRAAAVGLLKSGHVNAVIGASYDRLLVDEYQDCSYRQHCIIGYASNVVPTCVLGDPLQAIFDFGDDPLADWSRHVQAHFDDAGTLDQPWRWVNAGSLELGHWLLQARALLLKGRKVDLSSAPSSAVSWIRLDNTNDDHKKRLKAGATRAPVPNGTVVIIGDSKNPSSQQQIASQIPGAITVESVDLRDLVSFAHDFDLSGPHALKQLTEFAERVMSNVRRTDLLERIAIVKRGTSRKPPNGVESAALSFEKEPTHARAAQVLEEINQGSDVRVHRPDILRACKQALSACERSKVTFYEAAVQMRERNRLHARTVSRRSVGSTLLLKGLEADVAVILNADGLNARNLYVAMTRGARRLVVCARNGQLP